VPATPPPADRGGQPGDAVDAGRSAPLSRVVAAGLASGLLYLAMYAGQRAIQRGPGGHALPAGIALYLVACVGLFALYLYLLSLFRRPLRTGVRRVAVGLPVVYGLVLLGTVPVFSIDVFSYIAHGYVSVALDRNPYLVPSSDVGSSPIGPELSAYGWLPVHPVTPYGPLVTAVETSVVRLAGDDVRVAMLLFKSIALVASLAAAGLIWWILGRLRPWDRDLGTLAYLWNPAVMVEVAGEGHNDSLMTMLVLLALGLTLRGRVGLSLFVMAGAVATKYLPLLLVPLQVGYALRVRGERAQRVLLRLGAGAAAGIGLAIVLFVPYWAGAQTFAGARASGRPGHTGSTQTVLAEILSRAGSEPTSVRIVSVGAAVAVAVLVAVLALRVRGPDDLLRACAIVMVAAMLWISPAYWPWYVVLPVALLALVAHGTFLVALVSVSLASRLAAPLNSLYVDGVLDRFAFFAVTWAVAIGMPLCAVLAHRLRRSGGVLPGRNRSRYPAHDW
jgi:hypothetical protein